MNKEQDRKTARLYPIRPHHGLCLQFFEGKGYSGGFTAHMDKIKKTLESQEETEVFLTVAADTICECCTNRKGKDCIQDEKVDMYDRKVLEACGVQGETSLPWKEFAELVRQKIILTGRRADICPDCQWKEICEKKEKELL